MTPHTKFGFINDKFRCEVCGQMGGLKAICTHRGCVKKHEGDGDTTESLYFHPTCARQAGLEAAESGDRLHSTYSCVSDAHLVSFMSNGKFSVSRSKSNVTDTEATNIIYAPI